MAGYAYLSKLPSSRDVWICNEQLYKTNWMFYDGDDIKLPFF